MLNTLALSVGVIGGADGPTAVYVSGVPETTVSSSAIYAVLGYLVVFIGLVLLMWVIKLMGKVMASMNAVKAAPAPAAPAPAETAPAPVKEAPPAPGSAGEVKRYGVSDRDAALIMAIVADKTGKPLNELRFKSIKEVSEDEV